MLLQKIYSRGSLRRFEEFLNRLCEGLKVELTDIGIMESGWVNIIVSGEDEKVAVRFLEKEIGLAPIAMGNIERFSVLRGRVTSFGRTKTKVFVDVGVFLPKTIYAMVPLQHLQGKLVDGRKFSLEKIVELFGFVDDFPLEVEVVEVSAGGFEVELTERQLAFYKRWIDSRVDRLVVLGAMRESVREAIRGEMLNRDVLRVESLGFLEYVVVCKLGTDAVGLVSKLGRWLPKAGFVVFSPRRVLESVDGHW